MLIKGIIEDARAIFQAIRDLYEYGGGVRRARAQKFAGKWGNEGCVTGTDDTHRVEITLFPNGMEVQGIIKSHKLDDSGTTLGESAFIGKRRGYRIFGEVFKTSHRGHQTFGKLTLRLRKDLLELEGTDLVADFLPKSTTLWRYPKDAT